jgi:uncharacterized damage-inducible protein DinB
MSSATSQSQAGAGRMIGSSLLSELEQENASTRKTLERVPDDKFGWKPHEKSYTMGALASHLAAIPGWGAMTIQTESLDINPPGGPGLTPPVATNREELLALFDKSVGEFRATLERADDAAFMRPWSLLNGGQVMFTMPRVAVIRGMIMNHIIHHRAQLGVYLRLNDLPVPSVYGPSADEQS